jgi:hypothetical protein
MGKRDKKIRVLTSELGVSGESKAQAALILGTMFLLQLKGWTEGLEVWCKRGDENKTPVSVGSLTPVVQNVADHGANPVHKNESTDSEKLSSENINFIN